MTGAQAVAVLRGEIVQLAVAAAETCLRDKQMIKGNYLDNLDRMAVQIAQPAYEALKVIEREMGVMREEGKDE